MSKCEKVAAVCCALAMLLLATTPVAATTGGTQIFAWADWEDAPPYNFYAPNMQYATTTPEGYPEVMIARTWDPITFVPRDGEYLVYLSNHDSFDHHQTQVVAYGTGNAKCKLGMRVVPWPRCADIGMPSWPDPLTDICSVAVVHCYDPSGNRVNSEFVVSFSSEPRPEDPEAPALQGRADKSAAFFETTNGGTAVANVHNGVKFMNYGVYPQIARASMGTYHVTLPGYGTSSPGIIQVTAVGDGSAYCQVGKLPRRSAANANDLVMLITCWSGPNPADSDYILNYDKRVTRRAEDYQGGWAIGDAQLSEYTPSRSYNSGAEWDVTASTKGYRDGPGRYRIKHRALNPWLSSAWTGAVTANGSYCKPASWAPATPDGVNIFIYCFDAHGVRADTVFVETYQGPAIVE